MVEILIFHRIIAALFQYFCRKMVLGYIILGITCDNLQDLMIEGTLVLVHGDKILQVGSRTMILRLD